MVKINTLEVENVKRIRACTLTPEETGLTVIGGDNNQGKTSVLDAIAWALGGEKFRPSEPARKGSLVPPKIRVTLSNGLLVERSGKNSALKVTDPSGQRSGQQLLNEFVEALALDLPRFMESSAKDKADTLLKIIGLGDRVHALEREIAEIYNERRYVGQEADRKGKHASEMPSYDDVPDELVSPSELIMRQQEILAKNGENRRKREQLWELERDTEDCRKSVAELTEKLRRTRELLSRLEADLATARKTAAELQDESTAELEASLAGIEETNRKIRVNLEKEKAEEEAAELREKYTALTNSLEAKRAEKYALLNGAALPLEGLSVEDGELTYLGQKWDNMSGSDQLRVSAAIVQAINPECGFVLIDKLEQMDLKTLRSFGAWLEERGLQAIATRVSTGEECSIIIEDGRIAGESARVVGDADPHNENGQDRPVVSPAVTWKEGIF